MQDYEALWYKPKTFGFLQYDTVCTYDKRLLGEDRDYITCIYTNLDTVWQPYKYGTGNQNKLPSKNVVKRQLEEIHSFFRFEVLHCERHAGDAKNGYLGRLSHSLEIIGLRK
jgi:hypothetical protein